MIRSSILVVGMALLIIAGAIYPAIPRAATPTVAERARAKKIINLLKRYRRKVERLKSDHQIQVKRIMINHKAAIDKGASSLRACRDQKKILADRIAPSPWPWVLVGIGISGVVIGGAWGITAAIGAIK